VQPPHRGEHPRLHRAQRDPRQLGDLALGIAAEVGQRERLPLHVGQLRQRRAHQARAHRRPGPLRRVARKGRRDHLPVGLRVLATTLAHFGPHQVHGLVVGQPQQPGPRAAVLAAVASRITPQAGERLLHRFFGQHVAGGDPAGQPVTHATVPLVQLGERFMVTLAYQPHQDRILKLPPLGRPGRTAHRPRSLIRCPRPPRMAHDLPVLLGSRITASSWRPPGRFMIDGKFPGGRATPARHLPEGRRRA
jgi:hypothetical protein